MAYPSITYTFASGAVISHSEVNQNFSDLVNALSLGTKDAWLNTVQVVSTANASNKATIQGHAAATNITLTVPSRTGTLALGENMSTQVLTSGSGATYTTPSNCKYIRVRMVGGGGGGAGSGDGTGSPTAAGNGGDTVFGAATAGGGGGAGYAGNAGSGGTVTLGGYTGFGIVGARGEGYIFTNSSLSLGGGTGGSSPFGGAGASANSAIGFTAATNSGSGGGGGGTAGANQYTGTGGSAGAYLEFVITSPASTYTYSVGAGGSAGAAGGAGSAPRAGGAGGSGLIIVEEYYY